MQAAWVENQRIRVRRFAPALMVGEGRCLGIQLTSTIRKYKPARAVDLCSPQRSLTRTGCLCVSRAPDRNPSARWLALAEQERARQRVKRSGEGNLY